MSDKTLFGILHIQKSTGSDVDELTDRAFLAIPGLVRVNNK